MEKPGILSLINLKDKESEYYLEYLRKVNNTPAYDFINYLIGEEYIKFLDLLAGTVLKIPNHKTLFRDLEYIKIYSYVRDRGYTEESIKCAAKLYNKKVYFVRRAVAKVSTVIEGKEVLICNGEDCIDFELGDYWEETEDREE